MERYGSATQATDDYIIWSMRFACWTTGPMFHNLGINYTGPRGILLELITNLNVILYLSTWHTVYIIVLVLFMIML